MKTLVAELLERAEAIPASRISQQEFPRIKKGEQIIGLIPDELKRLYLVQADIRLKLTANVSRLDEISHARILPQSEAIKAIKENHTLRNEDELAHVCLWNSMQVAFPEYFGRKMAIRGRWQLVVDE